MALAAAPRTRVNTFDNEWIFDAFAGHRTFFTKRMFGGLAAYLHERLMLVLVEPTKTGRWKWHGVAGRDGARTPRVSPR